MVRVLPTRLSVTLIAWAPAGDRLAYTAGGSPEPHVLMVLDDPRATPRRLLRTTDRHFDWVTWSPDSSSLLLDDEHANRWRLLRGRRSTCSRALPRLGGRPVWCCPAGDLTGE